MKKYKIIVPCDYASGYLRYGHLEYEREFESEEQAKEYYKEQQNKDKFRDYADFELDDYELNDYGELDWNNILIKEVE